MHHSSKSSISQKIQNAKVMREQKRLYMKQLKKESIQSKPQKLTPIEAELKKLSQVKKIQRKHDKHKKSIQRLSERGKIICFLSVDVKKLHNFKGVTVSQQL